MNTYKINKNVETISLYLKICNLYFLRNVIHSFFFFNPKWACFLTTIWKLLS